MSNKIRLELIANAGVLIEYGGQRMLVDGLHHNEDLPFDGLPPQLIGPMLSADGPLADIDYLLFTHSHPDHFSPTLTRSYMQNNRVKGLVFPGESDKAGGVLEAAEQMGIACIAPKLQNGEAQSYAPEVLGTAGLVVAAFAHMGAQYAHRQSYTLRLDCGGHGLLFTGDSQPDPIQAAQICDSMACDTMFVNPLYYIDPKGGRVIEMLAPKNLVIYHLPQGDTAYKGAVMRAFAQRSGTPKPTFFEMGQTIYPKL